MACEFHHGQVFEILQLHENAQSLGDSGKGPGNSNRFIGFLLFPLVGQLNMHSFAPRIKLSAPKRIDVSTKIGIYLLAKAVL